MDLFSKDCNLLFDKVCCWVYVTTWPKVYDSGVNGDNYYIVYWLANRERLSCHTIRIFCQYYQY